MRPLIGISSSVISRPEPLRPVYGISQAYSAAVERAGGIPVIIPPQTDPEAASTLSARLDGILFTGGGDLEPATYGEERMSVCGAAEPGRDALELALAKVALERGQPVFGICRGMQLLNLTYGGSLIGHLPDVVGHDEHRRRVGMFDLHPVEIDPGTMLGRLVGERLDVHSSHHQGIGELGAGLVVSARARDGTVEAFEDPDRGFVVGVLWHPEESSDGRLFAAVVEAARVRDAV